MVEFEMNLSWVTTKRASPEMADNLSRGFRAQITTAMDAVLRTAVLGITEIFDQCVHGYCMELAEKGEVIARLEMKLQKTELLLKQHTGECDAIPAWNETKCDERETREGEDLLMISSSRTSPKRRFEVPPECSSESVTKGYSEFCPGIRLRQISIPLQHCSVLKKWESHQHSKGGTKKGSSPSKSKKKPKDTSIPKHPLRCHLPTRNYMKRLLQDHKEENLERPVTAARRRSQRHLAGEEQQQLMEDKTQGQKPSVVQVKGGKKTYFCKLCHKAFNNPVTRNVHIRLHKRCQGCKRYFAVPSALKNHQQLCPKLKSREAAPSAQVSQPDCKPREKSCRKKQVKPPSDPHRKAQNGAIQSFSCMHCNDKFIEMSKLEAHKSIHRDQKQFQCSLCSKRFCYKKALETHIVKWHLNVIKSEEDFKWMAPIEDPEEFTESGEGPREGENCNSALKKVKTKLRWQEMSERSADGFTCLLCKKRVRSRFLLIEHVRIHTGERPLLCQKCPMTFRTCMQLYRHKKKKHAPLK
ncbi:zinc finger protein 878-like isoform X1 [Dunckerocampus dactyliophorus]|uniref:zinc finger protein 878-like isoform X1 n=2 Tax=Dunckerocampus dactyliophorus TaxID=161453 RepID=UPI002405C28D|nr:zinc finger protein 878-like isoform X1 [Dunckerocampus dactyliophorus]